MSARVAVVVPTANRRDLLDRCLAALLDQQIEEPFEVVIADDAASIDTREQVAAWRDRAAPRGVTVRYIATAGRQVSPRAPSHRCPSTLPWCSSAWTTRPRPIRTSARNWSALPTPY